MAVIPITPVATTTRGGYAAEITGIDPTDTDCLHGTVQVNHGSKNRKWDDAGICRNSPEELNLSPSAPEVSDVIETAKKLSADGS